MSLLRKVQEIREKSIDEKVLEFAEKMEVAIIESAKKGYSSSRYSINDDNSDKNIMCSELFIEKLRDLLDGVEVEFKEEKRQTIVHKCLGAYYYDRYILFNWKAREQYGVCK